MNLLVYSLIYYVLLINIILLSCILVLNWCMCMLGKLILLVTTNKLVLTKDFYNLYHIQMLKYLDIQQVSRVDNKLVFNLR